MGPLPLPRHGHLKAAADHNGGNDDGGRGRRSAGRPGVNLPVQGQLWLTIDTVAWGRLDPETLETVPHARGHQVEHLNAHPRDGNECFVQHLRVHALDGQRVRVAAGPSTTTTTAATTATTTTATTSSNNSSNSNTASSSDEDVGLPSWAPRSARHESEQRRRRRRRWQAAPAALALALRHAELRRGEDRLLRAARRLPTGRGSSRRCTRRRAPPCSSWIGARTGPHPQPRVRGRRRRQR